MEPTQDPPLSEADARTLRFLRGLVIVLTVTMIAGMALLIALFAARLGGREDSGELTLPDALELPQGAEVTALTRAEDFWVVVTAGGEIFFFAPEGGAPLRQVSAPE